MRATTTRSASSTLGRVLDLVPVPDRPRTRVLAGWLSFQLGDWARAGHLQHDPRLAHRLALTVASIAPGLPRDRLALLARYALWSVALDDEIDAVGAVASEHGRVTGDCVMRDELLVEFAAHDRAGALPHMLVALRDAIDTGHQHARLSARVAAGHAEPPDVERYLEVAGRHVNYRSFAWGLALLVLAHPDADCRTTPLSQYQTRVLHDALTPASRAVRIANDIASIGRDRVQGRLNLLHLRHAGGGRVTPAEAWRTVEELVREHRQHLRDEAVPPRVRAALVNCLRVSVGMYRVTDLRPAGSS